MADNTFSEVKQAIAKKDYDKARNLLLQIDHPRRDEWLALLEQSVQRQRLDKLPKPWNPSWISGMSVVMTPLIASMALAWNWRRFGKRDWVLSTIIGYFIILILLITSFMMIPILARPVSSNNWLNVLSFSPIIVLAVLHFLYPFYIAGRQSGAYKLIQQKGLQAGYAHEYNWGRGTAFYIAQVLLFTIGIGLWVGYQLRPQTFDDSWVQVTYPGNWTTIELSALPRCTEDSNVQCRLAIQKGSFGSVGLLISSLDIEGSGSAGELGASFWQILLDDPLYDPIARDAYPIAGLEGYYVAYTGEGFYATDIFAVADTGILYISIFGYSKESIDENMKQIEDVLQTIRLYQ